MIIIDKEKCIGCGLCVSDCVENNILLVNHKATIQRSSCIKCGHCIGICPQYATNTEDLQSSNTLPNISTVKTTPNSYLTSVISRRSIRNFTDQKVERHLINQLITVGRYSHTAANRQTNSYIVIQDALPHVRSDVIQTLKQVSNNIIKNPDSSPLYLNYAKIWELSYEQLLHNQEGFDYIFHKSNLVLIVNGDNDTDVAIAATNIENLVYSLGLGMYYSTFIKVAIDHNPMLQNTLGITKTNTSLLCLVIGYPNVSYYRLPPRRESKVTWM